MNTYNITLLGMDFETEAIFDVYESCIWSIRYKEPGEVELYLPNTISNIDLIRPDKYLFSSMFYDPDKDTAHLMIIETLEIDNTHLKVSGRSLKSILNRRIIWDLKKIEKNTPVLSVITDLLNDNFISPNQNPTDQSLNPIYPELASQRRMSELSFDTTSGDWGTYEEETQYESEDMLSVMDSVCEKFKFGYSIVFSFIDKKFHMKLTEPVDHSYDQYSNKPIVFSTDLENLRTYKYLESTASYKNVAYVSGEKYSDDEINKWHQIAIFGDTAGLLRREQYIDGSSITHLDYQEPGQEFSDASYQTVLEQYGQKELAKKEHQYQQLYDGEIEPGDSMYEFGKDYDIGDIVEFVTPLGSSKSRITEMVLSVSASGITLIPTVMSLREEED